MATTVALLTSFGATVALIHHSTHWDDKAKDHCGRLSHGPWDPQNKEGVSGRHGAAALSLFACFATSLCLFQHHLGTASLHYGNDDDNLLDYGVDQMLAMALVVANYLEDSSASRGEPLRQQLQHGMANCGDDRDNHFLEAESDTGFGYLGGLEEDSWT